MGWASLRLRWTRRATRWRTLWQARGMPEDFPWPVRVPSTEIIGLTPEQQQAAVDHVCAQIGARREGDFRFTFKQASINVGIRDADGTPRWLKISAVTGAKERWRCDGERAAQAIDGVPQPKILHDLQWIADGIKLNAFVYSLASSPSAQETPWISGPAPYIDDAWIAGLKQALDTVGAQPLSRWLVHPGRVARIIVQRFGRKAPYDIEDWRMAHGDLHWANVTAPSLSVLDWEFFGAAPRGYDVAMLLVFTMDEPDLYGRIESAFADDLNSASGRAARLLAIARRLGAIENGLHDPRRYEPLEREAERLLGR